MSAATPQPLKTSELADIQGFIIRGYNMAAVRHFVVTIGDAAAAKAALGALTTPDGPLAVTTAAPWPEGTKPEYALNVAMTAAGLEALRLPASVSFGDPEVGNFAPFLQGAVASASRVGDVGTNAPEHWVPKLSASRAHDAHLLISLYCPTPELRDDYSTKVRAWFAPFIATDGPAAEVFEWDVDALLITLPDGRTQHKIHFGYTDGISNPIVAVEDLPEPRPGQLPYVMPWQFVMREDSPQYNTPKPAPLGLNGSFTAFRILEQDVEGFDAFLAAQGDADDQEYLASKLCGRWRNGNPVVTRPDEPGEVLSFAELRDFDYGDDRIGEPCPYSSHTRRSNPRGGPGVAGVIDKTAFRIMRRANPYGAEWHGTPDGVERGLAGHFICASLTNQFEFIMDAWVNKGDFAAKPAGLDPLLAHIDGDTTFTYYRDSEPQTVSGMEQFVTTRGGLYCFLPSVTALRWIAEQGDVSEADCFVVPST